MRRMARTTPAKSLMERGSVEYEIRGLGRELGAGGDSNDV